MCAIVQLKVFIFSATSAAGVALLAYNINNNSCCYISWTKKKSFKRVAYCQAINTVCIEVCMDYGY